MPIKPSLTTRLLPHIRLLIYGLALIWAVGLVGYAFLAFSTVDEVLTNLMQTFALSALIWLFFSLTPGLLKVHLPRFRYNSLLTTGRRALGVSTFFFALVHALLGFFYGLAGSLKNIQYLPTQQQPAIILGLTAFLILTAMALTSFDAIMHRLGKRWKKLHQLVYVAAIFILLHANLIGGHFGNGEAWLPFTINNLAFLYIILEARATAKRLEPGNSQRPAWLNRLYYTGLVLLVILSGYLTFLTLKEEAEAHDHGHHHHFHLH